MKRTFLIVMLLVVSAVAVFGQGGQTDAKPAAPPAPPPPKWKVGDIAPDFTLPDTTNKKVTLSDFRGKKNVVLAFFVLAFTGG